MKKTISILLVAVFVVASVVGVTAAVSNNIKPATVPRDTDEKATSSELYEVVDFVPPEKTVYSLSDVQNIDISIDENENRFVQNIDFDGTGMSMTVRHKETGKVTKYDYTCEYFDFEGEPLKCEGALSFYFNPGVNVVLTEGKHTTEIMLITDDDECVLHEMEFTLVDDTKKETVPPTQAETKTKSENKSKTNTKTNKPESNNNNNTVDTQESIDEVVIPELRSTWYHSNNPTGCVIKVNNQNGNTLDLSVSLSNENATKIALADINVTLSDVYYDGSIIRGEGSFNYTDSFGNEGTGGISVSENVIILVFDEEYNAGRGFGIANATGKFL